MNDISNLSNPIEQESVVMEIVESNPNSAKTLCPMLHTKLAKSRCKRFMQRPHLSTVDINAKPFKWTQGPLYERLALPADFQPMSIDSISVPVCHDQAPGECIEKMALSAVKDAQYKLGASYCLSHDSKIARYDCMFTIAEKMPSSEYGLARHFCALSGAYAPECHNHLILGTAVANWTNGDKHAKYVSAIEQSWGRGSYADMISSAYWSTVASRVAGVIQPFSVDDFAHFPDAFKPHLHSAIALRTYSSPEPIKVAMNALTGGNHHLPKAHGPGSPVFRPRSVWKNNPNRQSIYFCDIRGGRRPTSQNKQTDVELAILTAMKMSLNTAQPTISKHISSLAKDLPWIEQELIRQR